MRPVSIFAAAALLFSSTATAFAANGSIAGVWSGVLNFSGGQPLLFVLKIDGSGNALTATASSPYQGGGAIPVDSIAERGNALHFSIAKLGVSFDGAVHDQRIDGTFTQHGTGVPLTLLANSLGTSTLNGAWLGTLDAGGMQLLLGVRLTQTPSGALSGVLDSPDQHAFGVPLSNVTKSGTMLSFAMAAGAASFKGTIGPDAITGTFTQNGASFPLTFTRPQGAQAVQAQPTPLPTAQPHFTSQNVSINSTGAVLSGTLTIPQGVRGRMPAFVFVHGSGPGTRNGGDAENPTFLDLSNALSNAGVVVLRYDKRGIGKSTGKATEDWRVLGNDVRAAVAFLREDPHVDRKRIFLLGHSEGGLIVPLVARSDKDVAGIVLMAPPAIPMTAILRQQSSRMSAGMEAELDRAFESYAGIDPAHVIAQVNVPILVLQGSQDMQVLPSDLHHLTDAARAAQKSITIDVLSGDDHLFLNVPPGHPPFWEYTVPEPLDPRVAQSILSWMRQLGSA